MKKLKIISISLSLGFFLVLTTNAKTVITKQAKTPVSTLSDSTEIQKIIIPVKGMTCGGCASRVTKAVKEIDGVKEVDVNLERKEATISFDNKKVTAESIANTISDLGYKTGTPKKVEEK